MGPGGLKDRLRGRVSLAINQTVGCSKGVVLVGRMVSSRCPAELNLLLRHLYGGVCGPFVVRVWSLEMAFPGGSVVKTHLSPGDAGNTV